jgi:hypothetical protein
MQASRCRSLHQAQRLARALYAPPSLWRTVMWESCLTSNTCRSSDILESGIWQHHCCIVRGRCEVSRLKARVALVSLYSSVQASIVKMQPGVYQFLVGCFAALGSFLFGYDLAVIAEVVAADNFKTLFLQDSSDARSGTVVALFTAGCFTGALGSGFTNRIGRRAVILMGACIFIVGGTIQTAGVTIGMLYAGRYIAGCGVG